MSPDVRKAFGLPEVRLKTSRLRRNFRAEPESWAARRKPRALRTSDGRAVVLPWAL